MTDQALAELQRSLLEAVLLDRPLPGAGRAPAFGDRAFFADRPTIALLAENLAPGLSFDGLPLPVRVLERSELAEAAKDEGDIPYLRFSEPDEVGDGVRLGLEASIATADPERRVLGLSGILATFREVDGSWQAEETASLAS